MTSTAIIQTMIEAAEKGGGVLLRYFGNILEVEEKSTPADYRTKADVESEAAILGVLERSFPSYNVHSEERGKSDRQSDYTFLIDPLDGTNNYVLGLPIFSVHIALLKGTETQLAVVHQPLLKLTYVAERGRGVTLNGVRLRVSRQADIARATISYTCTYTTDKKHKLAVEEALGWLPIRRMLRTWTPGADYGFLASGRIEAVVNDGNEVYDFIPGKLMAREAGALVTDFSGEPDTDDANPFFIASNGTAIHERLVEVMSRVARSETT